MAPKTEPGGNPKELESLLKDLHRLIGIRPQPLEGIVRTDRPNNTTDTRKVSPPKRRRGPLKRNNNKKVKKA